MLNDVNGKLEVLGWQGNMNWDKPKYELMYWVFLSSLRVNWNVSYDNWPVHIHFQLLIGLLT